MAYKRKTWEEKMNPGREYKIEITDKDFADIPAGSRMLVATPGIVGDYIRQIPLGSQTTLPQMRKDLAAEYHADYTCPVTSGIFVRIVAEHAWEQLEKGASLEEVAPFWRIIDLKTPAAKKLSFGTRFLAEQRRREGL